jgi:hypothetical protein
LAKRVHKGFKTADGICMTSPLAQALPNERGAFLSSSANEYLAAMQ